MIHELKTWPEYYEAVKTGKKNFEVRKSDRDFQVDDDLSLLEYDPIGKRYTGRSLGAIVTYVLGDPQFVKEGFVILGININL